MIDAKTIPFMSKDEALATPKSVHKSNASSEQKKPLFEALEKRISNLNFDSAVVVKSDFDD